MGSVRAKASHRQRLVVVGVALALTTALVVIVVTLTRGGSYTAFRRKCAAVSGATIITLHTTTTNVAMGAPVKDSEVGCRASNGTILATFTMGTR
jgi:hypothetical protein